MKKLKTFAFCTLLAALAANHTPATAANGPTGDAAPATRDSEPKMYAWEQERDAIPSYTDLVLCYGGSHHRTPYRWDKERFTPFGALALRRVPLPRIPGQQPPRRR